MVFFGLILLGLSMFPGPGYLFPITGEGSFQLLCCQICSQPFTSFFSFWNPYTEMLVCLMLSERSLKLSLFLFILFSFFCLASVISIILFSSSLICSSASLNLLLFPSSVFLILVIIFFSSVWFFFISSLC